MTRRSLDLRYLARPPAESYRPYFSFVERLVLDVLHRRSPVEVIDVGCANGAFIHFLSARHPQATFTGVDALPQLVADAAVRVPGGTFLVGDIAVPDSLPRRRFDLVTMLTLHSHFDRLDHMLDGVMTLVAPGGRALLFGTFNPIPADALVRLRTPGDDAEWQPGWNIHSRWTVDKSLAARGLTWAYHEYSPSDDWPERAEDPLRTCRAVLNGRPVLVNGAGLVLPFAALEIQW